MRTIPMRADFCSRMDSKRSHPAIERLHRQLNRNAVLAHYFRGIRLAYENGVLTVEGSVPTFALKSLTASLLSRLDDVDSVHDRVSVISATGLSRVQPTPRARSAP